MKKEISSIPTEYNHRTYRSRLEARWACFFDLCGWSCEYEAMDLNGWIPDFVIKGKDIVLVEVKTKTILDETLIRKMVNAIQDTEIEGKDLLLLGSMFPEEGFLGWTAQYIISEYDWGKAAIGMWSHEPCENGIVGFCHEYQSFYDRITGKHDGGHYGDYCDKGIALAKKYWAEAGNMIQWKK